jgi:hypothetical protein
MKLEVVKAFRVAGVEVTFTNLPDATEEEAAKYIDFVKSEVTTPLKSIVVTLCDDGKVDVSYLAKGEKFERIRRITGTGVAVCC